MTYQFAGFLAYPCIPCPNPLPPKAVWKSIDMPFVGTGLFLESLIGQPLEATEIRALATELGITNARSWLFLLYECWGGKIDFVYGLGSSHSGDFGPIEDSNWDSVTDSYVSLMQKFGVLEKDAMELPIFKRGYWND